MTGGIYRKVRVRFILQILGQLSRLLEPCMGLIVKVVLDDS